jgi:hypothetical protein
VKGSLLGILTLFVMLGAAIWVAYEFRPQCKPGFYPVSAYGQGWICIVGGREGKP